MKNPPLGIINQKESYRAMIRNAVGSTLFRNLYGNANGKPVDIVEDGTKSCALFVSTILHTFYLVETPHAGVAGLERDLIRSGWKTTDTAKLGDVIVWEPLRQDGEKNMHAGFYLGDGQAISNDSKKKSPQIHPYNTRTIKTVYWNEGLR